MRAIAAECECCCDSLTFSRHINLRHLLLAEPVESQLDRMVAQCTVALASVSGDNSGGLCADEVLLLQLQHIIADSVGAHLLSG